MRIAINGSGIAGPTLAWWLREYGHEPILFEKAPKLREGGYIVDFWGTGYDVADKMGILPALKEDSYAISRVKTVTAGGWVTSSLNTQGFHTQTNGRYMGVSRADLARRVFDACEGIETRFGTSIDAIEDRPGKVMATFSNGEKDDFDLIIGADGLHSKVREIVFGPEDKFEYRTGLYVAAFVAKGYRPRTELSYISHTQPGRQISRVALRDDMTLFLFIFSETFLGNDPATETEQRKTLRKVYGGLGWESGAILSELGSTEDLYFDRVSQIRMDRWSKGRVALVGDAGGCASLLAGEGTGLAMTEAYFLAGELHKAADNHQAAFEAYHTKLHEYVTEKQDTALTMAELFAPKSWFQLILRDVGMNLTHVPYLGSKLLEKSFRDDLKLPNYGNVPAQYNSVFTVSANAQMPE